jgi:hypothetical protein
VIESTFGAADVETLITFLLVEQKGCTRLTTDDDGCSLRTIFRRRLGRSSIR